jgi:hypothetical protein
MNYHELLKIYSEFVKYKQNNAYIGKYSNEKSDSNMKFIMFYDFLKQQKEYIEALIISALKQSEIEVETETVIDSNIQLAADKVVMGYFRTK